MELADNFKATRTHRLVHGARAGHYTMPAEMLAGYDQLQQLLEEGKETTNWGRTQWADTAKEREAEALARHLSGMASNYAAPRLITEHLQPALAERLDRFRTVRQVAGKYAHSNGASLDMLAEPDDVRAAILELHTATQWYGSLRDAWSELRGDVEYVYNRDRITDPLGKQSPLAEVRNIAVVAPNWRELAHIAGAVWPWGSDVTHLKLGWLLDHGAEVWLPTEDQQTAEYQRLRQHAAA
ncbi:hypothetical protein GCM10010293_36810 [Streptomyces griseoflavus]|uniref:hypothetical protein n=1 Tax=Streptomyces griseoflavus TaxID=35619 RepID=UPI00167C87A5|nr:hypothetical protein [Streptomyces griseoflavus]GGV34356.1 hypothetical protein GCM10010293_36810 [Streptomyces griseoflavus]